MIEQTAQIAIERCDRGIVVAPGGIGVGLLEAWVVWRIDRRLTRSRHIRFRHWRVGRMGFAVVDEQGKRLVFVGGCKLNRQIGADLDRKTCRCKFPALFVDELNLVGSPATAEVAGKFGETIAPRQRWLAVAQVPFPDQSGGVAIRSKHRRPSRRGGSHAARLRLIVIEPVGEPKLCALQTR